MSRPLLNPSGALIATQTTIYHRDDPAHLDDVTSISDPLGKTWLRSYDVFGDLASTTDPLGNKTKYGYDTTTGWLTSTLSPRGAAANVTFPCTPPALGCTVLGHDAWGHVSTVTDANAHTSTTHYDADGNVDYTVDADTNRTDYLYDDADQQKEVHRAGGTTTATEYRGDGLVESTSDGAQALTAYAYDHQGRLTSIKDPDQRITSYGYDPAGNPVTKADPGGTCPTWPLPSPLALSASARCTVMQYFDDDRLKSVTYSDGVTPKVSYEYYDNGQRKKMTDGTGTNPSTWTFDSLNRLTQTTDGAGHTVSYGYIIPGTTSTPDLRDPATAITYGPSQTVKRDFDAAGRMTSTTDWLGNLTQFHPDADSNLDTVTFPGASGLVDSYGFDNADQLMTLTDKAGGTTRSSLTYQRDNANQVRSVASTGTPADTHSYTYTLLNQLKNVDAAAYAYDNADNLKTLTSGKTQAFDAANQLCWTGTGTGTCATPPAGATTYSYDGRGNRTAMLPAGQTATNYTWDQANRLIKSAPAASAGQYTALTPARVLDTRAAFRTGVCPGTTCATLGAGQSLTVKVAGQGGVPASGAAAVVLSVVATNPSAVSYLTMWPSDSSQPATSTLNWSPNKTVSNLATVKVAADGTIKLFNGAGTVDVILDVDGWYSASGTAGAGFNALNPVRILDTRTHQGSCPPATCTTMGTASTMKLQVAGQGGIPATGVSAVAINITVTGPTTGGYLTVWPSDQGRPTTSSVSFAAGVTLSELVFAKVAPDGTVSIYNNNGNVDVIADVSGWFGVGTGSSYQPLIPARILDTRAAFRTGTCTGTCQTVPAGGTLVLTVAGKGGVPATGAGAVALNVVADLGTIGGYLTVWPTDSPRPTTSQLSYDAGSTAANAVVTKLAADGTISIYASNGPVDVIVDVSGYYLKAPPTVTYSYNGDGLRATKTVVGGITSTFTWDEASFGMPVLLNDGSVSYIYGPDGLPVEQIANGVATWYHHDQLGSTRSLTNASGAVVGTATYDAYGNLTTSTGTLSPLGFSGEYTDAETGFVYLRARYYDPGTGQFLSVDPANDLTHSRYGYVGGDPLNGIDPYGLFRLRSALAWTAVAATVVAVATMTVVAAPVWVPLTAGAVAVGASAGVTAIDCRRAIDAACILDGIGTVASIGSVGASGISAAAQSGMWTKEASTFIEEGTKPLAWAVSGISAVLTALGVWDPHHSDCPSTPRTPSPPSGPGYTGSGRYVDWDGGGVPYAP